MKPLTSRQEELLREALNNFVARLIEKQADKLANKG
jgi:hypothetical protein